MEWLDGSTLESAWRKNAPGGQRIWLGIRKNDEKAYMFVSKGLSEEGTFTVFTNVSTNVGACKFAGFLVEARNMPQAARRFIESTGIKNEKDLKI
jgi:hypothetical protein